MSRPVKLGLIQISCGEDAKENWTKAIDVVAKAVQCGAQIICTQELFQSRYFCQSEDQHYFDLAEEIAENSPIVRKLSALAAEQEIVLIA